MCEIISLKESFLSGCTPKKCGRVVFDTLVTPAEVAALLHIAERGLALGGSAGGASILDLHSGALSHGNTFVNIFKLEEAKNVFTSQDFKIYRYVYKCCFLHEFRLFLNLISQSASSHETSKIVK